MKKITVTIDGHAGAGKSTTAKLVAAQLGYLHLNSGALYRAITYHMQQNRVPLEDTAAVQKALDNVLITYAYHPDQHAYTLQVNKQDVGDQLYTPAVEATVSKTSSLAAVRDKIFALQQELGAEGGVIAEGRDMGTKVFPNAELKIFLTAEPIARAKRRHKDLTEQGHDVDLNMLAIQLQARDHQDKSRPLSPLKKAPDAIEIDTTYMPIEQVVAHILHLVEDAMDPNRTHE